MTETWRPVVGMEGQYEVSDQGRVRSVDRVIYRGGAPVNRKGKLLSSHAVNRYGHQMVNLGAKNSALVHVLVAAAFIGPKPAGLEVRHLNGDPQDNRAGNLAYGTRSENQRDQYSYGGKHAWGKLSADDVGEIRKRLLAGERLAPIARDFGVSVSQISAIKTGRSFNYI